MKKALSCLLIFTVGLVSAGELNGLNSFTANTPAVAAEVNENFTAVKTEVDDNDNRIDNLISSMALLQSTINQMQSDLTAAEITISAQQSTITQLEGELTAVQNNSVLTLDGYLSLEMINGYNAVQFSAVNVFVNNGSGTTSGDVDGLGNLIVGYNEYNAFGRFFCDDPQYDDELNCTNNGGVWQTYITNGSHNLIVGMNHSYTSFGSFIAGAGNISQGEYSSVSGGAVNIASGNYSSVSGGYINKASGLYSSISGGVENISSGVVSSVSGGVGNKALAYLSSISGGRENNALGDESSILGGNGNVSTISQSAIFGAEGTLNTQQTAISTLQNELLAVQGNSVLTLDGFLSLETINGYDTAEFSMVNLMINNGTGTTGGSVDGLGNLIVGYNENTGQAINFCSDRQYDNQISCANNGGNWQSHIRTGSHNLIIGSNHSYTNSGSLITGQGNVVQGEFSSVSGGRYNLASGDFSSVSGGHVTTAPETYDWAAGTLFEDD